MGRESEGHKDIAFNEIWEEMSEAEEILFKRFRRSIFSSRRRMENYWLLYWIDQFNFVTVRKILLEGGIKNVWRGALKSFSVTQEVCKENVYCRLNFLISPFLDIFGKCSLTGSHLMSLLANDSVVLIYNRHKLITRLELQSFWDCFGHKQHAEW